MKKATAMIAILAAFLIIFPTNAAFALSSEINVTKDGQASMSSAKVIQIAGNTLFTRLYWGDAFIRFTIKTNSSTKFFRASGEATSIAEVKEGDILDVAGSLEPGSDTLILIATSVKNSSVQKEQATLSGTVTSINLAQRQFSMTTKDYGGVTVNVSATTPFTKGSRTIDIGSLNVGDVISKTSGDYDYSTKTLVANSVTVYVDMSIFTPHNFAGKLTEAPTISSDGSATLKVLLGNIAYIIIAPSNTIIMRANRSATTLERFVAGDSVRFYGAIQEADLHTVDVEVIRNMSL